MTASNITQFRELILSNYELANVLYSISDRADFAQKTIEMALSHSILLTEADVAAEINAGSRSWVERWI